MEWLAKGGKPLSASAAMALRIGMGKAGKAASTRPVGSDAEAYTLLLFP
jgi:hypothetical protein